jgi:phosphopantetheinyl transferase
LLLNGISLDSIFVSSPTNNSAAWSGIDRLQSACLGIILLDIETLSPVEERLFTPREAARAMKMGPRRRRGFAAARVALKRLARQLGLAKKRRPDRTIETLGPDDVKPCLARSGIYCSVSHSGRFVTAVAHTHPVGVDLEKVSEKVMRTSHLSMSPKEKDLVSRSRLGQERTATRVWTTKEAAAKALGLHVFRALREVEVVRVGEQGGVMRYQGKTYPVRHAEGNGYILTLVTCDNL